MYRSLIPIRALPAAPLVQVQAVALVSRLYQSAARRTVLARVAPSASCLLSGTIRYSPTRSEQAPFRLWVQEVGGSNPPSPTGLSWYAPAAPWDAGGSSGPVLCDCARANAAACD